MCKTRVHVRTNISIERGRDKEEYRALDEENCAIVEEHVLVRGLSLYGYYYDNITSGAA